MVGSDLVRTPTRTMTAPTTKMVDPINAQPNPRCRLGDDVLGLAGAGYLVAMNVDVHIELVDVDVVLGAVLVDGTRIEFAANLA